MGGPRLTLRISRTAVYEAIVARGLAHNPPSLAARPPTWRAVAYGLPSGGRLRWTMNDPDGRYIDSVWVPRGIEEALCALIEDSTRTIQDAAEVSGTPLRTIQRQWSKVFFDVCESVNQNPDDVPSRRAFLVEWYRPHFDEEESEESTEALSAPGGIPSRSKRLVTEEDGVDEQESIRTLNSYSCPRSTLDQAAAAEADYSKDNALRLHLPLACTFAVGSPTNDPAVFVKGVVPIRKYREDLETAGPSKLAEVVKLLFSKLDETPYVIAEQDRKRRLLGEDDFWQPSCKATDQVQAAWLDEPFTDAQRRAYRREAIHQFGFRARRLESRARPRFLTVCYVSQVHANTYSVSSPLWDSFLTAFMKQCLHPDAPLKDLDRWTRSKIDAELMAKVLAHQTYIEWADSKYAQAGVFVDPDDVIGAPAYTTGTEAIVWSKADDSFRLSWALHDWNKGLPDDYHKGART